MRRGIILAFQIAAVFIGTIVGAGLASGQEIKQFFTEYGYRGFWGILICCFIYIVMGYIISSISLKYNLKSYNELINLVIKPKIFAGLTDGITSLFLISGSAIILAGSGALVHQYFKVSKWVGILVMAAISLIILLRDTKGLIEINSFIVPSLIIVLITIFILYIFFSKEMVSANDIKIIPRYKDNWFLSTLLYSGFNILGCSGVIVPLSAEMKNKKSMLWGIVLGALVLTALTIIINFMLLLNVPYIFKYEIPLLYISNRFGSLIQILLLGIIWLEMFSTEVSDVYSVGKALNQIFNISYKTSVVIIILTAIPISLVGFVHLISIIYPAFGIISLVFMVQCIYFYFKNCR
ncbi:transporter [Clostridium sp. SYSU_GA19001]|uniref:YkvI family membrane protein n=1 Tax=Clostridium caldaquaticum TaxID=2940653 RepID=UPI0020779110|nr:transporter [Clostridium caldaquaticum]MCM8709520.1 transporter [Clostridium caldaquaticum]